MSRLRFYAEELQRLTADGESLVAAELCQQAFGADQLERSREEMAAMLRFLPERLREQALDAMQSEPEPAKGWERVLERVLDAASGDLIDIDPEELLWGVSASGRVGSWAAQLSAVINDPEHSSYCVVTDQRLIIADWQTHTDRPDSPTSFTELISVPRNAVFRARRQGRFLQRGRVVLDFADLSQLALMTGILFTSAATRLVRALQPRPAAASRG